jgi:branched-chain amino acid transport system permease protein
LAVVVTMGVRSITAAALSGMAFALLPGVFQTYVPARWGSVPAILFGLGAVAVARHPEGAVLQNSRQLRALVTRLTARTARSAVADSSGSGARVQAAP